MWVRGMYDVEQRSCNSVLVMTYSKEPREETQGLVIGRRAHHPTPWRAAGVIVGMFQSEAREVEPRLKNEPLELQSAVHFMTEHGVGVMEYPWRRHMALGEGIGRSGVPEA